LVASYLFISVIEINEGRNRKQWSKVISADTCIVIFALFFQKKETFIRNDLTLALHQHHFQPVECINLVMPGATA